ncbi:uncharacterized protein LOC112499228 isoform X3 [Citrus sinensis]|uniref:uncharacterized protein LOC112499228 isoform X3 n=1 Tax=Citrus sinensis TaxID=2711 RepID=UPI002279BD31|nr:uncharacterized protein LOC112499228 isoform X3 [Citrus sinensis]
MLEELKLIQYAFNKEADGSYREILNRHSLLTLLPEAYLCGEVIYMKVYHLTLIQQVVEKDVAMNWYLPTRYSQEVLMVRDEVDFFARAARYGKNYMQHVHRCQKLHSLDWILQPQLPSNMQHFKFKTFQSTGALEFQSKGMDIIVGFM